MTKLLPFALAVLLSAFSSFAQVAPDASFGNAGFARTNFNGENSIATSMALQTDGKIVVCGYSYVDMDDPFETNSLVLSRYLENGNLDEAFGDSGKVTIEIGSYHENESNFVAVQANGKILVLTILQDGGRYPAVLRFNTDGSLDESFNGGGLSLLHFGVNYQAVNAGLHVLSNGKILIAGKTFSDSDDMALMRLNANGSIDTAFGQDGLARYNFGETADASVLTQDQAYAMSVLSDGKILLGGYTTSGFENQASFGIIKLNSGGSVDTTFGTNGKVVTNFSGGDAVIHSLSLDADGKIYASGTLYGYEDDYHAIATRYLANGLPDATFGDNGKVVTDQNNLSAFILSSAVQSDGKLVTSGYTLGDSVDFLVIRYDLHGNPDATFGENGVLTADFGMYEGAFTSLFQPDGKLLLAGTVEDDDFQDFGLLRLTSDVLSVEKNQQLLVTAWPNPFTDVVYLKGIGQLENVVLHDNLGREVSVSTDASAGEITRVVVPSGLSSGLYLLKIRSEGKESVVRLLH